MEEHGKHIKLQIYGGKFETLKDVTVAGHFLVESVKAAGMRPLDVPMVYDIKQSLEVQGVQPHPSEPEGVTGIVVLSTSHVAIHTSPHRGYAAIDVYSCRDFQTAAVIGVLESIYPCRQFKVTDISESLYLPPLPSEKDESCALKPLS
mgnify:FL=1